MELSRAMVCLKLILEPLEQLTQFFCRHVVMHFSANRQIGAELALILAELADEADGNIQVMILNVLIDQGEVL
jgi:hypothetical protein